MSFVSVSIASAASLGPGEEKLVLGPPHPEIPPTFWEHYGAWIIAGIFALLVLGIAVLVWMKRTKAPVVIPIEVQTRAELAALHNHPVDGRMLSQVSRILRKYLITAFQLPPEEMTTTELCSALDHGRRAGRELAVNAGEFLRGCDERKFAPAAPEMADAIDDALKLVEAGEARRQILRAAAAAKPPVIQ